MTNKKKTAPFWLELDPSYIDANVDAFVQYMKDANFSKDAPPILLSETTALLHRRCDALVDELHASRPGQADDGALRLAFRLLPVEALACRESNPELSKERFVVFLEVLSCLVPGKSSALARVALDVIAAESVRSYGIGWCNLSGGDSPAVVAAIVTSGVKVSGRLQGRWLQGCGSVCAGNGSLQIWPVNRDDANDSSGWKPAFPCIGGVSVMLPGEDASKADWSPDAVRRLFIAFDRQARSMMPSSVHSPRSYAKGDVVAVRYVGTGERGDMLVETVDGRHKKVSGRIRNDMPVIRTYTTADLRDGLNVGDVFPATIDVLSTGRFHVLTTLNRYIIENEIRRGRIKALCTKECAGRSLSWLTENGYPVSTAAIEGFRPGDVAILNVLSWTDDGNVKCHVVERMDDIFDEDAVRTALLRRFAASAEGTWKEPVKEDDFRSSVQISALARLLVEAEKETLEIPDRIGTLFCAAFLAEAARDEACFVTAWLALGHLLNLSRFAGRKQEAIELDFYEETFEECPCAREMRYVASLLKGFGKEADWVPEPEGFEPSEGTALLLRVAVAAKAVAGLLPDDMTTALRMKACEAVRIPATDACDAGSTYIGPESGTQEQKSSFVYAPKNAPEQCQEKTIFKVVASFLNSETGGNLYIGVNDAGYVNGLDDDFRYVERHYPANKGMDGYLRYIRMRLQTAFPQEVYTTLSIEPMFDGRAVVIRVPSYPYGVVELDGAAWIRFGPECIRMSDALRERIDSKRRGGA